MCGFEQAAVVHPTRMNDVTDQLSCMWPTVNCNVLQNSQLLKFTKFEVQILQESK